MLSESVIIAKCDKMSLCLIGQWRAVLRVCVCGGGDTQGIGGSRGVMTWHNDIIRDRRLTQLSGRYVSL